MVIGIIPKIKQPVVAKLRNPNNDTIARLLLLILTLKFKTKHQEWSMSR